MRIALERKRETEKFIPDLSAIQHSEFIIQHSAHCAVCAHSPTAQLFFGRARRMRLRLHSVPQTLLVPVLLCLPLPRPAKQPGLETLFKVYNSLFRFRAGAKLQLSAPTMGTGRDGLGQMCGFATGVQEK